MTTLKALGIVLDLAEQNVIDDPEMQEERDRQAEAIEEVRKIWKQELVKNGLY